jgi:hypothetical protein
MLVDSNGTLNFDGAQLNDPEHVVVDNHPAGRSSNERMGARIVARIA